jgi:NAD(P)-dependent dehydrogenase (short-subunit alcohol dehydrogenase family)
MAHHVQRLFDLTGKTAVVTGGARGIGRAAARWLAAAGASVIVFDRLTDELEQTRAMLEGQGRQVATVCGDLRSNSDVRALVARVERSGDGVDVLVNSAGIVRRHPALEMTLEDLDALWDVNVRGLIGLTQALLPMMTARGRGKIINLGSLGTVIGLDRRTAYAATKGAVGQYTRSLAAEVGRFGICVNAIAPGYVDTDMAGEWINNDRLRRETLLSRIPLGRFASPDDLAGAFLFLASAASDYVTGQILLVDGGWTSW